MYRCIYTVSHADDLRDEKCTKSISARVTFLVHPVLPTLRQRKTDRRKSTRHPRDNVFGKPTGCSNRWSLLSVERVQPL